ncbi:N-formylglutamate deformylase [Hephaestia mangrovi]|uniref:N-formylglutamate deformylase n=1 Tax=Hephaestia mangrovi TaxID=2873268 RepID=UPI001CA77D05|nr:N-formylglutamate deformylase [Hephaestia mangrovi]
MTDWLSVSRGDAPLVLAFPHTGTDIPVDIEARLVSPDLARKDADWWVDKLYAFAADRGATMVRTSISRSVIDVNRDPWGASLYPGQATTGLCPVTTFDGEPLYRDGEEPDEAEIDTRKARWFAPYHDALAAEIDRLHKAHGRVVLYDCHSIRSVIPRLFDGALPHFNIGTYNGTTCAPELEERVAAACDASAFTRVVNGRFKGGWTTRHYGAPDHDIHAIQMELACRGYLDEPIGADPEPWPVPFDPEYARPMTAILTRVIQACLEPL